MVNRISYTITELLLWLKDINQCKLTDAKIYTVTLPVLNVLQHKCWNHCSHKSNQIWYLPFSAVFHVASLNETTPPENINRGKLCTVPWAVNEAPTGGSWFPVCAKLTHHRNPSVHRFVQPLKLSRKKCYDCCIVSSVWGHIAWLFQTLIDTT